ncbi:MAG: C39 family peptidase [Candidatus Brocadiae bacterium]|nr:C39 family peptidase [Candidatus Brocadiia bacterium]
MNKRMAIFLLFLCVAAHAQTLNVPQCYQEKTQWCWAGCTQATLSYYGKSVSQSTIAQHGSHGENNWIWLWGQSENPYRSSIQNLLAIWKIPSSAVSSALSQSQVQSEINAGRPVQIRWGWDSGGGHFVLCKGINGSTLYVMDPWSGPTVNSYSWVVKGNGHTWTHTLYINR